MGRVYLARDLILGRSIALKLVGRAAGSGREIEEAQMTARFSHPHIVQLYDVGEYGGAMYLALEYLDGESLKERTRRERLSLDEILRISRSIADALVHAHEAGVRHCDLKPSNVVLPRDGRLRVVDFGLASTLGSSRGGVAGTPDWMAPEQWRGEDAGTAADIWALAVIVHELIAGEHPFGSGVDASIRRTRVLDPACEVSVLGGHTPDVVIDLVRRSLSRAPSARPSAADWLRTLEEVIAGRAESISSEAPYRGLAAFSTDDAHLFHGRDADLDEILELLRTRPSLAIVGPSGAGKSSFLYAGVIARLLARERWRVVSFRPGTDPFHALASCLVDSATDDAHQQIAALSLELRSTPTLLALRLHTLALAERAKIILAIDQLEELFTQGTPTDHVAAFVEMLSQTSVESSDPVRVIATLRDDFSGRIPGLRDVFVLRPMTGPELRRAIAAPLLRTRYRFEDPTIVDEMVHELGEGANLPMLQFACRALWDARDTEHHHLSRAAYRAVGGVAGALARHADRFIAGLSAEQQAVTRALLLKLVAGTTTRRIVERMALLADLPAGAEEALATLLAVRLVVQRRIEGELLVYVELAHESLLGSWSQLRNWIDRTADQRQLLDELTEAAAVWSRRGRASEETWSAAEVAAARHRAAQLGVPVPAGVERFLSAGEERHVREQRRARIRIVLALLIAGVVTSGALVIAQVFRSQRSEARLARGNLGRSELVLQPFDWRGDRPRRVEVTELPRLSWTLYGPDPANLERPGPPIPEELLSLERTIVDGDLVATVQAPGGLAFLRIDGRGRAGEVCSPAWIRLQALPGYVDRVVPPRFELPIPTCAASRANTTEIPEGDALYGGPGVPPSHFDDYVERERIVHVPRFAIDTTEVSNAAFAPFAQISKVTGYPVPVYPDAGAHEHDKDPWMPVTSIDAAQAEAFCRFMGKRLPSDYEWTKAARGGVEVGGARNPAPARLYPWGTTPHPECVNGDGAEDGYAWVAPVHSFPCGASPYGVLHLVGNAAEWISREGQSDPDAPLRVVRGGACNSPPALEQLTTVFRNTREGRHFDFAIGVRCVDGPDLISQ